MSNRTGKNRYSRMPLFYQQDINASTRLAVWKLEETEDFFSATVPLQREISHPHKRLQHLAGRYLLRYLFPAFPYEEILIADTRKPFLPSEAFHFSISHCGDYAAAIVSSSHRVGIDIETFTERVHRIKHKYLHPQEQRFVNTFPAEQQTALLTFLWSAKEAMFKWWGNGDVDFSEVLRVMPFAFAEQGSMDAMFWKDQVQEKLVLHFRQLDKQSLVWTATPA